MKIKNLIQRLEDYKKLIKDYQSKHDWAMANYYISMRDYIEQRLEIDKKEKLNERRKARKIKENNKKEEIKL